MQRNVCDPQSEVRLRIHDPIFLTARVRPESGTKFAADARSAVVLEIRKSVQFCAEVHLNRSLFKDKSVDQQTYSLPSSILTNFFLDEKGERGGGGGRDSRNVPFILSKIAILDRMKRNKRVMEQFLVMEQFKEN